jgi:cation:H+ antiporter
MGISFFIIVLTAAVIWFFSVRLEGAAHALGENLKMPASVKGAVLYAIPSSFPELATAVMAVLAMETPMFEVGVGTIAGSAVFNILVIPALSVLVASAALAKKGIVMNKITVSPRVFLRDGVFYLFVVLGFITLVSLTGTISKMWAVIFILAYVLYVYGLYLDTKRHRSELVEDDDAEEIEMSIGVASGWLVACVTAISVACYFLVEHTIEVANQIGLNAYIVAVVLTAAATSIPDALISVNAAKKGGSDAEEAIVNAFSSNIFDLLICLSVPVLLYPGNITLDVSESIVSLILLGVVTVIALILIKTGNALTKVESVILLVLYVVFVLSAIFNDAILHFLGINMGGAG